MTPALHDIEHEIGNLFSALEDMEPVEVEEHMPSLLAYAEMLAAQEAHKADGIAFAIRRENASIQFLKDEEQRLRARRQAKERALERFREHLLQVMTDHGIQKIKGDKSTLFIREDKRVVIECNPQELPQPYVEQRIDWVPDKRLIKEALVAGIEVSGTSLEARKSVQVR
jgi:hypothetical protein